MGNIYDSENITIASSNKLLGGVQEVDSRACMKGEMSD